MHRPESSPDYLAHCVATFVATMREAEALSSAGKLDELPELLRHAAELLDIIADGLEGRQGTSPTLLHVQTLRDMLGAARGLLSGPEALH